MQLELESGVGNEVSVQHPSATARLAILFVALQGLDVLTTVAAFSRGGVELNPVVSSMMPWTGRVLAVLASKAILVSLVIPLSRRKRILYFADILYCVIVAWNLAIIFALK